MSHISFTLCNLSNNEMIGRHSETWCSLGFRIGTIAVGFIAFFGGVYGLWLGSDTIFNWVLFSGGLLGVLGSLVIREVNEFTDLENLKPGSQRECDGNVDKAQYLVYVDQLNKIVPSGVYFEPEKDISELTGGTCSVKIGVFLAGFLADPDPDSSIENYYQKNFAYYQTATPEDRTIQAAFNSIKVRNSSLANEEKELNKAQALLSFFDIKIINVSFSADLSKLKKHSISLLKALPNGSFFVRAVKRTENEKGEIHGHSLALIKKNEAYYLYEPNTGLHRTRMAEDVLMFLEHENKAWDVPSLTIYACAKNPTV